MGLGLFKELRYSIPLLTAWIKGGFSGRKQGGIGLVKVWGHLPSNFFLRGLLQVPSWVWQLGLPGVGIIRRPGIYWERKVGGY